MFPEHDPAPTGYGSETLAEVVARRLRPAPPGALDPVHADVVLHDDAGDACTIEIRRGAVRVRPGRPRRAATEISADRATVAEVADGVRSGVEAFLHGDLVVRGNLALALGLDGLLDHPPAHRATGGSTATRFTRSDVVSARGIPTFHIEAGDPQAPPVVLLHGLGATNASMLPTFHDLAADHRVLAPDLPGHGATHAPRGRYDARYFCSWLDEWMGLVGLDSAVLIGNSLGGRISVETALRHPTRVRGLILLCPAVTSRRLRQLVPLIRMVRPELGGLPLTLPLVEQTVYRGVRGLFAHPERIPEVWLRAAAGEFSRCYRKPHRRVAFLSALRQVYVDDAFGPDGFWTRLPALTAPTLCVWGGRDRLVSAGFARHVAAALPHATTITFPDCGHVPQFEEPERTSEAVRSFLADLQPLRPVRRSGSLRTRDRGGDGRIVQAGGADGP